MGVGPRHNCDLGLGRLGFLARYGVGCVVCITEYLFHRMSMLCYVIYTYFIKIYVKTFYTSPVLYAYEYACLFVNICMAHITQLVNSKTRIVYKPPPKTNCLRCFLTSLYIFYLIIIAYNSLCYIYLPRVLGAVTIPEC